MDRDKDGLPLDPPEPSAAELAERRRLRQRAEAIYRLPTAPYLGLTLQQAQARAESEGRRLRIHEYGIRKRADLTPIQLNVALDRDGRVREARAG